MNRKDSGKQQIDNHLTSISISPRRLVSSLNGKLPSLEKGGFWQINRVGSDKLIHSGELQLKKGLSSRRQLENEEITQPRSLRHVQLQPMQQLKSIVHNAKTGHLHGKSKFGQKKPQSLQCPFSSDQEGYLQYFLGKSKADHYTAVRHSKYDKSENLLHQAKSLEQQLKEDPLLGPVLGNSHEMQGIAKLLIEVGFGEKLNYSFDLLRNIHQPLGITEEMFRSFKVIYIRKMMSLDLPTENVLQCARLIESHRGAIVGSVETTQSLNMATISREMYSQVWADYALNTVFQDASFEEQVSKFSKIFSFVLNTAETTNYVLDSLRCFHAGLHISQVQFSIFKYYLSQSLQNHLSLELTKQILKQVDCYKAAIIDQDSVHNLVVKKYGKPESFLLEFQQVCKQDRYLNKHFVGQFEDDKFLEHAKYLYSYLFHKHNQCFVSADLRCLHANAMPSVMLKTIKLKLCTMIQQLNPYPVVFEDFLQEYQWLECIMGKQENRLKDFQLKKFIELLAYDVGSDLEFRQLYASNQVDIRTNLFRKFSFLISGETYYKVSDIQAIHARLNISNEMFDEFKLKVQKYLNAKFEWVLDEVEKWRVNIVSYY